ncbi:30S ribosomal protein S6 [Candidatus Acidulodesulfobacterium sp. H_13]|uniref:30S ribosomal protein S6 n=1 Tax=Candidatus Acidulodesulfobacterium sp. H_13 TaxID=3395470 RepID=UPI003AF694DD
MAKKVFLEEIRHIFPKKYEILIILNPDIDENKFNQFLDKIKGIMSKNNAEFLDFEDWGTKKLSYDIKKFNKGRFIIVHFEANGSFIQELERNLKIADDCMRFQTVVLIKSTKPKKKEKNKEKEENKEESVVNE